MSKIARINDETLNDYIGKMNKAVVKFGAEWCGPCKMIAPVLEELADELADVSFAEVDIDDTKSEKIVAEYNVQMVPTVVLFENGKMVKSFVGFKPKQEIINFINDKK